MLDIKSKPEDWGNYNLRREIFNIRDSVDIYSLHLVYEIPLAKLLYRYVALPNVRLIGDLGCGNAAWLAFLARNFPKKKFIGIDFQPRSVRYASVRRQKYPNLSIVLGDCRKLPFKAEQFDFLFSLGVVEHFPDHIQVMHNWVNSLRIEGFLLLTVPNMRRVDYLLIDLLNHELSRLWRQGTGKTYLSIRESRIITNLYGYEERWKPQYLEGISKILKLDLIEKFGLQAFVPLLVVLNILPPVVKTRYYKFFSRIKTDEKNGLIIGGVYTRASKGDPCDRICVTSSEFSRSRA